MIQVALENSIFIHKSFKHQLPQLFYNWFGLSSNFHTHTQGGHIWAALMYLLTELNYMKKIMFVLVQFAIFTWNYLQNLQKYFISLVNHKVLEKITNTSFFEKICLTFLT